MEGRKCWSRDRDNVVKVQLNGKKVGVRGGWWMKLRKGMK